MLAKQFRLGKMTADAVVISEKLRLRLRFGRARGLVTVLVDMNVVPEVAGALTIFVLAIARCHRIAKLQWQDQKQQDAQQSTHETSLKTIPSE